MKMSINNKIPLKLPEKLKDLGIEFYVDTDDYYVKLRFNSIYNPAINLDVPIDIIKEKNGWDKFANKFNIRKTYKSVSDEHNIGIYSAINENGSLIRSYLIQNEQQKQQQKNLSDVSDVSDQLNNGHNIKKNNNSDSQLAVTEEKEQNKNDIPVLGVLPAIRTLVEGPTKIIGRIVGRSTNFKVILRSQWKCLNPECQNEDMLNFYPPIRDMPKTLDTSTGTRPSCRVCRIFGSLDVKHDYEIAKIILLDDVDTIEEKFDRLNVVMYGDASNKIIDGEIVNIEGDLCTQKISSNNGSKIVNVLHSNKLIIYKNRKEINNTQTDIEIFHKWKKVCVDAYRKEFEAINRFKDTKREERPDWVKKIKPMIFEQRVTAMFAPNVHGHSDAKMGILRSIIGGSKKENGADNGRRGRIHTNLIGDPGTAKTALSVESTKVNPNSRMVDAAGASGKSLVGIVDKENDSLMVKYGVVVAAKNSHVVINEASALLYDDQGHLVGIAEEGKTTLDKWGEHISIDAPTTLIFTTNPIGTKWESSKMSKDKMIVIKPNLLDRIDQTYGFFDNQTEEELEGFTEELDKIANKKPHYYNFLSKYLQYVKTIEPEFVGTTKYRLNRFWINAKLEGVATNRSFFSIKRIAGAQAKLNLSWEIDDNIARKTMNSLQLMYSQYGTLIEQIQNPRDLTVKIFYNILKENKNIEYSVKGLCKIASEKNKQVNTYLRKKWDLEHNIELRNIVDMVEQKQNVKFVSLKPKTLVYYDISFSNNPSSSSSSLSDLSDQPQSHVNEENNKKIVNEQSTTRSDTSDTSDSISSSSEEEGQEEESLKGFQFKPGGRIYEQKSSIGN